jgi:hypothetical protein
MNDFDYNDLAQKIANAIEGDDEKDVHIFNKHEVDILKSLISWVEFGMKLKGIGKVLLWIMTTIGAAYLMYGEVMDRIRGAGNG